MKDTSANAIVHRAVWLTAENAAACQFLVFEGARELEAHPLSQLLTRRNPRQDGGVFFEMLYAHLLLAGNAHVELVALDDSIRKVRATAGPHPADPGRRRLGRRL